MLEYSPEFPEREHFEECFHDIFESRNGDVPLSDAELDVLLTPLRTPETAALRSKLGVDLGIPETPEGPWQPLSSTAEQMLRVEAEAMDEFNSPGPHNLWPDESS